MFYGTPKVSLTKSYGFPAGSESDVFHGFSSRKGDFPRYDLLNNGKTDNYINALKITTNVNHQNEIFSEFGSFAGSARCYGGVLAPDGYTIYGVPFNSPSVLKINTLTDTISSFGAVGGAALKWSGGVLYNEFIFCVPYAATNVLKIDTKNDTVSFFGSLGGTSGKWSGGCVANEFIFCAPNNATSVLRIDPVNNTTLTFGSFTGKYEGGIFVNGLIYCTPLTGNTILVIDPLNLTTRTFGGFSTGVWRFPRLATNGMIYAISTSSVLKLNPYTETVSIFGSYVGGYANLVSAPNGFMYAFSYTNSAVIRLDTNNDIIEIITLPTTPTGTTWFGSVLSKNGSIYNVPYDRGTISKFLSPYDVNINFPLNPFNNKF